MAPKPKSMSASSEQMAVIASRDSAKVSRYYHEQLEEAIKLVKQADKQAQQRAHRR